MDPTKEILIQELVTFLSQMDRLLNYPNNNVVIEDFLNYIEEDDLINVIKKAPQLLRFIVNDAKRTYIKVAAGI